MIAVDRDVLMMIAVVACIAASVYLFRELSKTKEEVKSYKMFTAQMANHMSRPRIVQVEQETENETETETETEPEVSVIPPEPQTPRKGVRKVKFSEE